MPSKVGVLESMTFSHTPEEAMSVGLGKACVPWKNWFCSREIEFFIEIQAEWEVYIHLHDSVFIHQPNQQPSDSVAQDTLTTSPPEPPAPWRVPEAQREHPCEFWEGIHL